MASKAAGAVICKFTFLPYLIDEHLLSLIKLVLIIDWGGYITFPPSMKRISLY